MMKQAGFELVRLGHLAWDSYEPDNGVYTFEWFDQVMDLFAQPGYGVLTETQYTGELVLAPYDGELLVTEQRP